MIPFSPTRIRLGVSVLFVLVGALLAPAWTPGVPWTVGVPFVLLAGLLALARPAGTPGMALAAGGALAVTHGSVAGAGVVGLGLVVAGLLPSRGPLRRAREGRDDVLAEIPRLVAAGLLGAAALSRVPGETLPELVAGTLVLASAIGLSPVPPRLAVLRGLLELLAWGGGAALGQALGGEATSLPLLLGLLGALSALAFLQRRGREEAESRVVALTELSRAGERVLADGDRLQEVVEQIRSECRRILPFDHFELEIPGDTVWSGGPQGELAIGPASPGESPPPLPGIHRRPRWEELERVLSADGREVARLRLWWDPRRVETSHLELLEPLLPQMAASLQRSWLDRRSKRDALTGLPQRRVLDLRLEEAFAHSRQSGRPLSVILCDIDHFKRINDSWGHAVGDQALVRVAELLESHRRDRDLCCRWGGEEFALLLEATDGEIALQVAERLREVIEATVLEIEGNRIPLTMSAGAAAYPELFAASGSELLTLADSALYEAKHQGRNRVFLYQGPGRYRDPAGTVVLGENLGPKAPTPRFFA